MQLSQYSTTQCVCLSRQACVDVCVCRGGGDPHLLLYGVLSGSERESGSRECGIR